MFSVSWMGERTVWWKGCFIKASYSLQHWFVLKENKWHETEEKTAKPAQVSLIEVNFLISSPLVSFQYPSSIFVWCLSCRTQAIATSTLNTNILSGQGNKSHMSQNCSVFFSFFFRLISAMCRPVLLSLNILDPPAIHTVQFRPITSIMCVSLNIYRNKCSAIFWRRWHQTWSIQN